MVYDEKGIEEIVVYINGELLKGRPMKELERVDFGVNERVITKRLARKNIKKIDGQFVLQDGSKMPETKKNIVIGVSSGKCGFHTLRAFSPLIPTV